MFVPAAETAGFKLTPGDLAAAVDSAYQSGDPQLSLEPHRCLLRRGRTGGPRARMPRTRPAGHLRRDLREAALRRPPLHQHRVAGTGDQGAHGGGERHEQELLHDRLAVGLRGRSARHHRRHGQGAEPFHEQPDVHRPVGGARGPALGRRRRGAHAPGVRSPAEPHRTPAGRDPRHRLRPSGGGLLRFPERVRLFLGSPHRHRPSTWPPTCSRRLGSPSCPARRSVRRTTSG